MIKLFGFPMLCLALLSGLSSQAYAQRDALSGLPEAPLPQTPVPASQATQSAPAPNSSSGAAPLQGAQAASPAASPKQESSEDQVKAEEKQRMLGIMPAFNSVEAGEAKPLRPSEKFNLWYHSAIDPFTFGVAAIDAGVEQAEGTYPEYHQGAEGFAKRFGAAYADSVDGNFWGNAVLPTLLRQDPRYFRLGHGSVKKRLWYSAISTVRCKGDNGNWQPNYSNVAGNLIGGAISNIYYPASDRGVGLIFERGFTVTAEGAFGALAFEFYPDAISYFKRRHQRRLGQANLAPPTTSPSPASQP